MHTYFEFIHGDFNVNNVAFAISWGFYGVSWFEYPLQCDDKYLRFYLGVNFITQLSN